MALLPRHVRIEDWHPIGVEELEANAFDVVRSTGHRSVIAGPGAGKTELLAQRAAFLLQTGGAPAPRRILAISFKRDAATNLAARVRKRCHRDHAGRFDSLTFDAFAKGLIDRFGQALPERWRPRSDYQIMTTNDDLYRGFLEELGAPPPTVGSRADIEALTAKQFEQVHLLGKPLPLDGWHAPTPAQWAVDRFWQSSLHGGQQSHLSFPMIGRLGELLLRANPMARMALNLTYSHLFMDEFQDTTQIQYDLFRTIFLNSNTIITAVGDNKQHIMRWALAMHAPFDAFETDFGAARTSLLNNYRASPDLVRIQQVLAQALDPDAAETVSMTRQTISGESCAIWDFSSPQTEAMLLARFVRTQIEEHDLTPRDFVLLVRQKAADYADVLAPAFAERGLRLRNEAALVGSVTLQELLAEEVSEILVRALRLAMSDRAGRLWGDCQEAIAVLRGVTSDDDLAQARLARELDVFTGRLRKSHPNPSGDKEEARVLVDAVLDFIGRHRLRVAHPAYRQGDWFRKVIEAATLHLIASATDADSWTEALDNYEGVQAVPLMTIHKSKGLEYHTVIFVGLDDQAWWSFTKDPSEGTAGFFVAFSRAKQQVIFTRCTNRARTKIAPLYELLQRAGVGNFPQSP